MVKKLQINLGNKTFYTIIAIVIILAVSGIVYATWDASKKMFHSANDVKVTISGADYSLQEAINDGLIGGSSLSNIACINNSGSLLNGTLGYADDGGGNDFLVICQNGKLIKWCHAPGGHGERGYHPNEFLC